MPTYIFFITLFNLLIVIFKKRLFNKIAIIDQPDKKRKIHKNKPYLIGGVIIFVNIILFYFFYFFNKEAFPANPYFFFSNFHEFAFLFSIIILFFIGLYDDKYDLSPYTKTFLFLIVFYILIEVDDTLVIRNLNFEIFDIIINLNNISFIFTLLSFLVLINALNMFDGINLQLTIFTLFILMILFLKISNYYMMLIMIIPLLFFILLNFNGFAFMGNSGSFIISFLIGYILLKNYNSYIDSRFSADQILLLLLYPVLDMLRLFFYRISKGKNPFLADRRHIHHVFLKKFTEKKTVFLIFLSYSIPNLLYFVLNFPIVYCLVLIAFFYSLIFIYLFLKNNKIINI